MKKSGMHKVNDRHYGNICKDASNY